MKVCAKDCVIFCANCKHWNPQDRIEDKKAPCFKNHAITGDYHQCNQFECVHSKED